MSPSVGGCTGENFACPLCVKTFSSAPDLELHVNIEHRDVLSPASPSTHSCPICGITLDNDNNVSSTKHFQIVYNFMKVIEDLKTVFFSCDWLHWRHKLNVNITI